MMYSFRCLVACSLLGGLAAGCSPSGEMSDPADQSSEEIVIDGMPPMFADGHPELGPHGGELIELGDEDYHVEMDHAGDQLVLYVLDGAAANPVAIEAKTLTVSLKHDGAVRAFDVSAWPQSSDPVGRVSRYRSDDAELVQWLQEEAEGVVVIEIDGRSYNAELRHDHESHSH